MEVVKTEITHYGDACLIKTLVIEIPQGRHDELELSYEYEWLNNGKSVWRGDRFVDADIVWDTNGIIYEDDDIDYYAQPPSCSH